MSKPRVLIDTNVLLSGLIWNGNESRLLEMSASGGIHILIPEFVLEEARRVLKHKFPVHVDVMDSVVAMLDYEILPRPASESMIAAEQILRDINDVEILASIIEFRPDYAVTGDKDLLTSEVQSIFPTSRCRDFLRKIADED
jgi:putative PIN family toxin of toxin-antitoxin system